MHYIWSVRPRCRCRRRSLGTGGEWTTEDSAMRYVTLQRPALCDATQRRRALSDGTAPRAMWARALS
eukprot:409216-Pyramimonas_sp.AAC.1